MLQQSGRYWDRFYKSGRWEVRRHSSTRATARLVDLRPFDPLMADYLGAYIHEMWVLMNADVHRMDASASGGVIRLEGQWR